MVGYDKGKKKMDAEVLAKYILGGHVEEYMETMQEEEPEKYQSHFSKYIESGFEPGEAEDLFKVRHPSHVSWGSLPPSPLTNISCHC